QLCVQFCVQLGDDIAIKAIREGKLSFPDGTIIALRWNEVSSEEDAEILAIDRCSSSIFRSRVRCEYSIHGQGLQKYTATGERGPANALAERPDDLRRDNPGALRRSRRGHQQQQQGGRPRLRALPPTTPRQPAALPPRTYHDRTSAHTNKG